MSEEMLVELHLGDCLDYMRSMPDKSVDAVITDPPYGIGKAEWDHIDFFPFIENLISTFSRILIDHGIAFVWIPKNKIYELKKFSFPFSIFIETKNFAQKRASDILIDCWVPVLLYRNGDYSRATNNEKGKNWFMVNSANTSKSSPNNPRNIEHPTAKDVEICKYMIESVSGYGDTILDPFMGSGTTGVACVQTGRNFIGIEINPTYFALAERRIAEAQEVRQ